MTNLDALLQKSPEAAASASITNPFDMGGEVLQLFAIEAFSRGAGGESAANDSSTFERIRRKSKSIARASLPSSPRFTSRPGVCRSPSTFTRRRSSATASRVCGRSLPLLSRPDVEHHHRSRWQRRPECPAAASDESRSAASRRHAHRDRKHRADDLEFPRRCSKRSRISTRSIARWSQARTGGRHRRTRSSRSRCSLCAVAAARSRSVSRPRSSRPFTRSVSSSFRFYLASRGPLNGSCVRPRKKEGH